MYIVFLCACYTFASSHSCFALLYNSYIAHIFAYISHIFCIVHNLIDVDTIGEILKALISLFAYSNAMTASTNWDPPSRLCFPSSTAWSLCHQLGSTFNTWDTSTLVILEFSDATSFIGEIFEDDISSGILRACVSGTLRGSEIR